MNKKLAIGISIIAGGMMLAGTALASGSSSSGYDIYKEAFKNTRAVTSMTGKIAVTVTDNGNVLLKSDDLIKVNSNTKKMSGSFGLTAGDQVKTVLVYRQDGQTITKFNDSEVYNVAAVQPGLEKGPNKWSHKPENPELTKDMENVVDLLVGDYQNYISVDSKADGNKQVSLQMSDSQVSPLVNAAVSLAVRKHQNIGDAHPSPSALATAVGDQIPKLVDEIRVTNIDVKADIDNQNFFKEQTAKLTITGKDAAGKNHEVVVSVDLELSNLNNTTTDAVDLTGKEVKTLQTDELKQIHRRHAFQQ